MLRDETIMLVEDDEVDIMKIKRAFKKLGVEHPLVVANDGVEALEVLRQSKNGPIEKLPKVVILDLNMPRMNGIEFLKEVRSDEMLKKLVVLVLTTSDQEEDILGAYDLNVAGYIVKPVTFENFLVAISKVEDYWQVNEMPMLR